MPLPHNRNMELTADRVREYLIYDPDTGMLIHRVRPGRMRKGQPATRRDNYGYLNVSIDGRSYKAHRIAWLYVHGRWPTEQLDHINGVRDDNRIENLREAGYQENGQNRAVQRNSTSGHHGVCWIAAKGRWRAQIARAGKRYHLGYFDTAIEASQAYANAKAELHAFQPIQRVDKRVGRILKTALTD